MKTFLKPVEYGHTMHVSHLFRYVSPCEPTKEALDDFVAMVNEMSQKAEREQEAKCICLGGMMDLVFLPTGRISLVMVHKTFDLVGKK